MKVDDVTLRMIDNAPYVWGLDNAIDSELFTLSSGIYTLTLIGLDGLDTIGQKAITDKVMPEPVKQGPYLGVAISIPDRIEAEDYDLGTEGLSYHDADDVNELGLYRADGVGVISGGSAFCIKNTINDEWQEYTINIKEDGVYDIVINYCSGLRKGVARISISLPDESVMLADNYKLDNAFGWDEFQEETIASGINLIKGEHILRSTAVQFGYFLDWIEIREQGSAVVEVVTNYLITIYPNPNGIFQISKPCDYEVYSISGEKLISSYGNQVDVSSYSQGIYILQSEGATHKLVFD